jgi:hypothetical protein
MSKKLAWQHVLTLAEMEIPMELESRVKDTQTEEFGIVLFGGEDADDRFGVAHMDAGCTGGCGDGACSGGGGTGGTGSGCGGGGAW